MNNYFQKIKKLTQDFFKDPFFLKHWEMPYYSRRGQNDNQLSVRAVYSSGKLYHYNGIGNNFVQHMYTGIMPFAHMSGQREKYPAKVEPVSPQKEALIASGLSSRSYRTSLADALYDFVSKTSHSLFMYGVVLFELVYEKDTDGNITSFHLVHLDEKYIFRFFRSYYQVIPWWIASKSHVRVQIIKIPADKILRIDFPKKLGGRRKLQKTLKRLWQLSKEVIPEFYMEAIKQNKNISFNFEEYDKGKYLENARVTARFGWNQSQTSVNYITEYYWFLRYLRASRAQAIVRGEIMARLNDFLNGTVLNLGTRVSIENLPTVESINEQEELMKRGDMKFIDIHNAVEI